MFSKWNEIMLIVTSSVIGFYEWFIVTSWPSPKIYRLTSPLPSLTPKKLYTYTHVFMKITQSGPILFCDL